MTEKIQIAPHAVVEIDDIDANEMQEILIMNRKVGANMAMNKAVEKGFMNSYNANEIIKELDSMLNEI